MNIHDEMSDDEVLRAAADTLSASPVAAPPEITAIMARARARRRRQLAGISLAGTAATAAAALSLTSVLGSGPAPALATGTPGTGTASTATGTIRTTAFTLVKSTDGTVKLTLTQYQMFNPGVLQQALAKDGIPALVKVGVFCSSHPAVEARGVISLQLPDGTPVAPPGSPGPRKVRVPVDAVTVINPAAIPAGIELSFDYVNNKHVLRFTLIRTDSYTCANGLPPGA